ncbi:hypothetical protein H072_2254 [Dactylellina haptotyla CBS 200.50]|uniref:SprT-like domain-containing protein n=1 Tax=Dactylellina haptotyla (strain CBS 200.50) TaxID=1284197 RepID=S8ALH5_DACHA|nr:hypothetical protein H072_2254 [Dactylellina haptotyla CBS 200.50]
MKVFRIISCGLFALFTFTAANPINRLYPRENKPYIPPVPKNKNHPVPYMTEAEREEWRRKTPQPGFPERWKKAPFPPLRDDLLIKPIPSFYGVKPNPDPRPDTTPWTKEGIAAIKPNHIFYGWEGCDDAKTQGLIDAVNDARKILGAISKGVPDFHLDWNRPAAVEFFGGSRTKKYRETITSLVVLHEMLHITFIASANEDYREYDPKNMILQVLDIPVEDPEDGQTMRAYGPYLAKVLAYGGNNNVACYPSANADSYEMFILSEFVHQLLGRYPFQPEMLEPWPYSRRKIEAERALGLNGTDREVAIEACKLTNGTVGLVDDVGIGLLPFGECEKILGSSV